MGRESHSRDRLHQRPGGKACNYIISKQFVCQICQKYHISIRCKFVCEIYLQYKCHAIMKAIQEAYIPWSSEMRALFEEGLKINHPR